MLEDWVRVRESILLTRGLGSSQRIDTLLTRGLGSSQRIDTLWTRGLGSSQRIDTLVTKGLGSRIDCATANWKFRDGKREGIIEIHVLERLTWMPFSDLNLTRIASSAPGQQIGKQHPSPIRWERLIIKQHGQHQPNKPEKENTQYSLNHLGMYSQSQISYKSSRSHKPEKGSLTPLNTLAMTGSETTFRGGGECQ